MEKYTAQQLIDRLGLVPHIEGGWYRFVWGSSAVIQKKALPQGYPGPRKSASLIYFLLKAGEESRWHWLRSAEIWAHHAGGTLEMVLGGSGPKPVECARQRCGPRLQAGESFTMVAPADFWQTTRVVHGSFALVSCVVSPGYHDEDFILSQHE